MKIINKVMYFMKKNFYKFVISPLTFLMVLLINKMSVYASSLGETIKGASNTAQTEALGLLEVGGIIGIVVSAICLAINQRKLAGTIAIGVIGGYIVLKFAPQIWGVITGGV